MIAPMLKYLDMGKEFFIEIDALSIGMGAVLSKWYQSGDKFNNLPVAFG